MDQFGDRARLEAIGLVPVDRDAGRLPTVSKNRPLWAGNHKLFVSPRSTIAAAIGNAPSKPVSSAVAKGGFALGLYRPPVPFGTRQAVGCSLHVRGYEAEGLIRRPRPINGGLEVF